MHQTAIRELIDIALHAAINAGISILDIYYNSDFGVEYKPDKSPLTIADKQAHQVIAGRLAKTGIPVLSEEGMTVAFDERKKWDIFWLVDPLDGTREFVKRNDEFTVNIALIKDHSPIGGVVYVPVTRTIYWADKRGAFKATVHEKTEDLDHIQQLPVTLSRPNFVIAGSRSHMSAETETYIQKMNTNGKSIEMRSKGSSLKICMVAEGEADIYPRLGPTMEWDTAAGHAVVKFSGKNIYQIENNEPLIYNKENLLNPWFVVK